MLNASAEWRHQEEHEPSCCQCLCLRGHKSSGVSKTYDYINCVIKKLQTFLNHMISLTPSYLWVQDAVVLATYQHESPDDTLGCNLNTLHDPIRSSTME